MAEATDTSPPSDDVPFPEEAPPPRHPVNAVGGGTVILEIRVDEEGRAEPVRMISGGAPFVQVAEATIRGWRFRPASVEGTAGASSAYVILTFRRPALLPPTTQTDVGVPIDAETGLPLERPIDDGSSDPDTASPDDEAGS